MLRVGLDVQVNCCCCKFDSHIGCWSTSAGISHKPRSDQIQRLGHGGSREIWWSARWILHPGWASCIMEHWFSFHTFCSVYETECQIHNCLLFISDRSTIWCFILKIRYIWSPYLSAKNGILSDFQSWFLTSCACNHCSCFHFVLQFI